MKLITFISENIKEHPFTSGVISSASTMGIGIVGLLSEAESVRFIASVGGLFGILLTLLSIYYKIRKGAK